MASADAQTAEFRTEHDTMGPVQVPRHALWKAQTQRAVENFPISGTPIEPALVAALGMIKGAAAQTNARLGRLPQDRADAIAAAAAQVAAGARRRATWRADLTDALGEYDALIAPTAAAPAWRAEDEAPPGLTPATQGMFGAWVNAAGLPGISVPGQPHPDRRPISVQIVAPFGHDAVVLEIAQRLETLAPWADPWPPMALTV